MKSPLKFLGLDAETRRERAQELDAIDEAHPDFAENQRSVHAHRLFSSQTFNEKVMLYAGVGAVVVAFCMFMAGGFTYFLAVGMTLLGSTLLTIWGYAFRVPGIGVAFSSIAGYSAVMLLGEVAYVLTR